MCLLTANIAGSKYMQIVVTNIQIFHFIQFVFYSIRIRFNSIRTKTTPHIRIDCRMFLSARAICLVCCRVCVCVRMRAENPQQHFGVCVFRFACHTRVCVRAYLLVCAHAVLYIRYTLKPISNAHRCSHTLAHFHKISAEKSSLTENKNEYTMKRRDVCIAAQLHGSAADTVCVCIFHSEGKISLHTLAG